MKELYTPEVMALAAHIPHLGRLPGARGTGEARGRICGSRICVWLDVDAQGRVSRFAQEVRACLVGQASASLLGQRIAGLDRQELARGRARVRAMLEEDGAPLPDGLWRDYAVLAPVRPYRSRHSTVLIAFDAALAAMDMALDTKRNI